MIEEGGRAAGASGSGGGGPSPMDWTRSRTTFREFLGSSWSFGGRPEFRVKCAMGRWWALVPWRGDSCSPLI